MDPGGHADRQIAEQLPDEFLAIGGLPTLDRVRTIVDWHWSHHPVDRREVLIAKLAALLEPLLGGAAISPLLRKRCVAAVELWLEEG